MEQRFYNRMLLRLLGLPIIALAVLAIVLGSGLQRVEMSGRLMDHSDLVIAHADVLFRLMVDEETGIRGYLLTHDSTFLEPLRRADNQFDPNLESLVKMVKSRPDQVDRLRQLQFEHEDWEIETEREITDPPDAAHADALLLQRKQAMDTMRLHMQDFLSREQQIRDRRAASFSSEGRQNELLMAIFIAILAILIAWITRRSFLELTSIHSRQLREIGHAIRLSFEREQWLNTTLRSIGDAVIACDAEGRVVFMNPIAESLTGWDEFSAKGRNLSEVFPIFNEMTREVVESPVDKVRRLGTIVGLANHTFLVRRDGTEISIDDSGAPIRNTNGDLIGVVMVFRDITDRKISDDALMRAEKLAAAGRLAASVAHEVNNPLEGLTNLVYIARTSDDLTEIRSLLAQADQELGRIAHITRQSLGFYREITSDAAYQPANVVLEVAEFYRTRAHSMGITLTVDASTDVEVTGVAGEVRQVFSNLLANSLDASASGTTLRIHARSAVDPSHPNHRGVRISIADSGSGIPPKHLAHIFEPFFTTKKDTGTGLGLWVSRQLVEKNGGTLRVRSSTEGPRRGTTFSVFLPCTGKPHGIAEEHAAAPNGVSTTSDQPLRPLQHIENLRDGPNSSLQGPPSVPNQAL